MSSRIRQAETPYLRKQALEFQVGDTVDVATRIVEGDKERIQTFTGRVIRRRGAGLAETFTVRRIVMGEGVERIFPLHSPRIAGVKVVSRGAVRRSKLYYLRRRVGKATRLRELIGEVEGAEAAVATPGAAAATSEPAAPAGTAAAGTAAAGKAPAEKPAPEKAPPAKAAAPKPAAAQAPAAKPPAGKGTSEKGTSEKGTAEKGTAEKGTAEKGTAEKGTAEKSTAEKGAEKASPQPAAKAAPAVKPAKS